MTRNHGFRLSIPALRDLREISRHIAADSPTRALRLAKNLLSKCDSLGHDPVIGRTRDDLDIGLRGFPVGDYLIFYKATDIQVEIVRILHGARDLPAIFDKDVS